ncbi:MAG: methionyl-tRNA formyltransferase [Clostridia bacterium]|nr:methionyl-tRNA formyltransferase [Clostridia bacterium]
MKVVFLGTPDFAVPSLDALHEKYGVSAVICQPDKAKNRKGEIIFGAVKQRAIDLGIPVYQFNKIREEGVQILKELAPDIMITCAYGQILSQEILDIPKYGILNVHGSLLPKYRGSAPIQWSIIDGEEKTGVTIMKTAIGMDTGDMVSACEVKIEDDMYLEDLYNVLKTKGAQLLIDTIDEYVSGKIVPVPQNEDEASKCRMITKEDAKIDFCACAKDIRNKIRGLGYGYFLYNNEPVKVYKAEIGSGKGVSGKILSHSKEGVEIACKDASVLFTELQMPGKKRMGAKDFINGVKMSGEVL